MSNFCEIEKFFLDADINRDGSLSMAEVTRIMKKSGFKKTEQDIRDWFRNIDKNCDNKITLDELKAVYAKIDPKEKEESVTRKMFQEFDLDGSGFITADELDTALRKMGHKADVHVLIAKVDRDGDGKINYEEFINLMS